MEFHDMDKFLRRLLFSNARACCTSNLEKKKTEKRQYLNAYGLLHWLLL
jgi:hypothetical protein